jgi:regulator of replication initiation timing
MDGIMMIAIQALEKRTALQNIELESLTNKLSPQLVEAVEALVVENEVLKAEVKRMKFEAKTMKTEHKEMNARLDELEAVLKPSIPNEQKSE